MTRAQILTNAVATAIAAKTPRSEINVPHWAKSYRVTQAQVRAEWERQMTKVPPSFEGGVEGK
jgi:hypothetical protein